MTADRRADTVVLDVDGTLVDSNYHHTLAWARAFRALGHEVPLWRIHRSIGMGGDRLVPHLIGSDADELGDRIREVWEREIDDLLEETTLLPDASELLRRLDGMPVRVVLASSGKPGHVQRALRLLGEETTASAIDHVASSGDAATKPAPDLIDKALEEVGGSHAVVVGDSVWDARAAQNAGSRMVGLLTGGFGTDELIEAGAERVFADLAGLIETLDEVIGLGRSRSSISRRQAGSASR